MLKRYLLSYAAVSFITVLNSYLVAIINFVFFIFLKLKIRLVVNWFTADLQSFTVPVAYFETVAQKVSTSLFGDVIG